MLPIYSGLILNLFPASAGMNRFIISESLDVTAVPRVRGDEPRYRREDYQAIDCSPRPRG